MELPLTNSLAPPYFQVLLAQRMMSIGKCSPHRAPHRACRECISKITGLRAIPTIYDHVHPEICIWDVWTCILGVWTYTLSGWTCILVSELIFWVSVLAFLMSVFWVSRLIFGCLDLYSGYCIPVGCLCTRRM